MGTHNHQYTDPQILAQQIKNGCSSLDLMLDSDKLEKLLVYLQLFIKWNKAYNLSAVRDPGQIIIKHILDSLSIARFLEGDSFADVGTGGGLPGIPLAIAFPEKRFTLIDSAGKKTRFLFQVKQDLSLTHVNIENCRVESFSPRVPFDGVVSRAFASLKDFTEQCKHLLKPKGKFWAMKGIFPQHELSELEKHYIVESHHILQVPGNIGERCLIVMNYEKKE